MNDKPVVIPSLNSVLDRLAAGEQPLLYQPPPPAPEPRSGGRRETSKSKRLIFQSKGMRDGVTAPITRKQLKRPAGMSAKEWKRARRAAREDAEAAQRPQPEE